MDIRELERVLYDQRDDLEQLRGLPLCHRPEESLINLDSKLAQVVIGVRRSGKSVLCFKALEASGVPYAYVNFDDDRLVSLELSDMDMVLETLFKIYGDFTHLFLDEIQNIDGWHLFANRMLRKGTHLVITGSNAKLLSGELSTHLTGRHHDIELFPFSFKDFCNYKGLELAPLTTKNRGLLFAAYDEYLKQGGFPELLTEPKNEHRAYIDALLDDIINKDIKKRFHIKYTDTIKRLANHLLNVSPSTLNYKKLQKDFGFNSNHTLGNYISYLIKTYILTTIKKYSAKSSIRVRNSKCYAIDVAFMDKRKDAFSGENIGWRMETIAYLELRRRAQSVSQDIYYYSDSAEADFIVCDGNEVKQIFQICYDLQDPSTRKREIRGALKAFKATHCDDVYILTDHEYEDYTEDGCTMKIRPLWEWLIS